MITKSEPGLSRPNDNPFDMNFSAQHTAHVGPSGHAPVQSYKPIVDFTAEEKAQLDSDLPKYLPPEFTATRAGPGRSTLTYIEGWKIKNLANKLFGFNGWSSAITDVTVDFLEVENDGKVTVGVSCIVRVTLKDGTFHEDMGYGSSENQKSKGASFEKAKKEAATDGLKRALTSFGNLLGTCLYDKNYAKYISTQRFDKAKYNEVEFYTYPTEARSNHPAAKPPSLKPQQQAHQQQSNFTPQQNLQNLYQNQQQQNPYQNQQQQKPYQNQQQQNPYQNQQQNQQQQTGSSASSSAQTSSWTAGQSNFYKPATVQQGHAAGKQPLGGPSFNGSSTSTPNSNENSMSSSVTPSNKVSPGGNNVVSGAEAQIQAKIKIEEDEGKSPGGHSTTRRCDSTYYSEHVLEFGWSKLIDISTDDLFFGPDIDDSAPSQALPESPRMKDFDNIDLDMGDMMNDDSPIKPKATTPEFAQVSSVTSEANSEFPATPKRSGSFGRSTSSPATTLFAGLNTLKNAAYTSRSSSPSTGITSAPQAFASNNNQGGAHSTSQNQQHGANNGSRATTPLSSHSGSNISRTPTSAAQPASTTKTVSANVLRANSLAAANGQHGNNNANNSNNSAVSGVRASTGHNSGVQSHNLYGNNNHQQGLGLKRPFINNGSHELHGSAANKEPRLD
ncbi:DNA repair protein rad52 [Linnemannia schmuckeri]|uniref:DNA repair protein rad52 n=1 Tax=Linnemannia schmuckeri TaxID=64567 RepID=A0A9P5VE74_9FUNG|nr:DNA repair protein rad52 [Linnemannia schmuckeri]